MPSISAEISLWRQSRWIYLYRFHSITQSPWHWSFTLNKQWFERAKAGSYRMYRSSNDKQDDDGVGRYFLLSMFD